MVCFVQAASAAQVIERDVLNVATDASSNDLKIVEFAVVGLSVKF